MIELILLEPVRGLGKMGDRVRVKPGYARNYLLPKGYGARPTEEILAGIESRKLAAEQAAKEQMEQANQRKVQLAELPPITLNARVSAENRLFGSVNAAEIAKVVTEAGVPLNKHEVKLEEPIRTTGEYVLAIQLLADVHTQITLIVAPEDA